MSRSLFTYGTLTFAKVWQRIGIGPFESQPATLHGYAAYRLQDAVFPGIVPASDEDFVTGVLYHGLDEETLFELDAYESDLYSRAPVQVVTDDGTQLECQAFVIPESHRKALTDEVWDAKHFAEVELVKYLNG